MTAGELIRGLGGCRLIGDADRVVKDLVTFHSDARPGAAFVALRGARFDGHQFLGEAADNGADTFIVEELDARLAETGDSTWIVVKDARDSLGTIAGNFFRRPWEDLGLVGVTGTNGKTSTCYLVQSVLQADGRGCARLGTVEHEIGATAYPATTTTPDGLELSRLLRRSLDEGLDAAVMEVSSHALMTARVNAVRFDVAVWTNLTQDHLDFHETMDEYRDAKAKLFRQLKPSAVAVLNVDDPEHAHYANVVSKESDARIVSFGMSPDADVRAWGIESTPTTTRFTCAIGSHVFPVDMHLLGEYSVMNGLAAIAVGFGLGVSAGTIKDGIESLECVPGRFEPVSVGQPFGVIVDYAHTPDALERALVSARALAPRRLIVVFGCGGNRDKGKRPQMGRIAAEHADLAIVTSDNPREEDPLAIIREIEDGMPSGVAWLTLPDREEAIAGALEAAEPEDVVVIAGKGHEDYQILGTTKIHFDDREIARKYLG